jgi:rod shape-determining protein MreD
MRTADDIAELRPADGVSGTDWTHTLVVGLALVLIVPFAALLQVTVAIDFELLRGAPDFLAVVVVSLGLLRGPEAGAVAGFAGGLTFDALAWEPLGLAALVYALVGYAAGRYGERMPRHAPVRPLLAVAVGTVAARVGIVVLAFLLGIDVSWQDAFGAATITSAAETVLLAIPCYPLLRRLTGTRRAHVHPAL